MCWKKAETTSVLNKSYPKVVVLDMLQSGIVVETTDLQQGRSSHHGRRRLNEVVQRQRGREKSDLPFWKRPDTRGLGLRSLFEGLDRSCGYIQPFNRDELFDQRLQMSRQPAVIRIKKGNQFATGQCYCRIARGTHSLIVFMPVELDPMAWMLRSKSLDDRPGPIVGPMIVHNDDLPSRVCLGGYAP